MVLPGHEDLKPRRIYGFTAEGKLLVDDGNNGAKEYDMTVSPSGNVQAHPPKPVPIDQEIDGVPVQTPVAQRWARAGLDQPIE
jgi:hypothetical protein